MRVAFFPFRRGSSSGAALPLPSCAHAALSSLRSRSSDSFIGTPKRIFAPSYDHRRPAFLTPQLPNHPPHNHPQILARLNHPLQRFASPPFPSLALARRSTSPKPLKRRRVVVVGGSRRGNEGAPTGGGGGVGKGDGHGGAGDGVREGEGEGGRGGGEVEVDWEREGGSGGCVWFKEDEIRRGCRRERRQTERTNRRTTRRESFPLPFPSSSSSSQPLLPRPPPPSAASNSSPTPPPS